MSLNNVVIINNNIMNTEEIKEPTKDSVKEIVKDTTKESKTISVKIPQIKLPSLQATILILLIVVGVLQTAQLYGLNSRVSSGQVSASTSPTVAASTNSTDSTTSSLPSMVGGC